MTVSIRRVIAFSIAAFAFSVLPSHADFAKDFTACVDKFAINPKATADVRLTCNAVAGKLEDCKIKEAPSPANGFDKAAMCVAQILPVGSKTGEIDVPLKFNPK